MMVDLGHPDAGGVCGADVVVSAISGKWLFQIFCRLTVYQGAKEFECKNPVLGFSS